MRARKSGLETTTETSQTILWGCFKKTQLWPVNSGALWHHPPHKLSIYSALASSHGLSPWTAVLLTDPYRAVSYGCRAWEVEWVGFSTEEAGCLGHEFSKPTRGISQAPLKNFRIHDIPYHSTPAAWAIKWECIKEMVWAIKPLNWINV